MDFRSVQEWQGYVVSGATREDRRARLAEVPVEWQDKVKRHVETAFAVRKNAQRR